jgi:hypothetical protein
MACRGADPDHHSALSVQRPLILLKGRATYHVGRLKPVPLK